MLILTILAAGAVLGGLSLPSFQGQDEVIYRGLHDRRKHQRVTWQELGYKEYCKMYIY
jgi:hypothetical protein